MVVITEQCSDLTLVSSAHTLAFRSRFKSLMAAHSLAFGEATKAGAPLEIQVPASWGDEIVIESMMRVAA